jgi:uncharacterized protein YjbJ (UPF0337 family)
METLAKQLAAILKDSTVKLLAGLICLASWMLIPLPAVAMTNNHAIAPQVLATMAQKMDAKAKETEGKVQSAYGEITGKPSEQIKGKVKVKQIQGSAKGTQQDIKQGAKSIAEKVSDAAGNLADSLN